MRGSASSVWAVQEEESAPDPAHEMSLVFTNLVRRIGRFADGNRGTGAEFKVEEVEEDLVQLAGQTVVIRREIEAEVHSLYGDSLDWAEIAVRCARHVLDSALDGTLQVRGPEPLLTAWSFIGARAISVASEILTLIRAGHEPGAQARWRTLYELRIHAGTLAVGNQYTCSRYLNHRYVMALRDFDRLLPLTETQSTERARIAKRCRELTRRYGPEFAQPYGWAAELAGRKIGKRSGLRFHDLERIAGTRDLGRHLSAHHAVHADALGTVQYLREGQFVSGTLLARGAQLCGDLIWVLLDLLLEMIRAFLSYESFETSRAHRQLDSAYAMVAEVQMLAYRNAAVFLPNGAYSDS
jgi:hypothetical protein